MSLQPQLFYLVPEETARVARAAFPHGNVYMRMYDTFGAIFCDHDFAPLFSSTGQPAESPVGVALATILHFVDMGYVDAELLANSQQEYGVELFGPARGDIHEQARAGKGFEAAQFRIDWEREQAICPAGRSRMVQSSLAVGSEPSVSCLSCFVYQMDKVELRLWFV